MKRSYLLLMAALLIADPALAQFRPPAFAGGVPGRAQFQAIVMQRHQARTLHGALALARCRRRRRTNGVPPGSGHLHRGAVLARFVPAGPPWGA